MRTVGRMKAERGRGKTKGQHEREVESDVAASHDGERDSRERRR